MKKLFFWYSLWKQMLIYTSNFFDKTCVTAVVAVLASASLGKTEKIGSVKVAGYKVYPRRNQNNRAHVVSACIGLWHHRLMHAPYRLMHACTACIAPWCHRLMRAVTAWALLFDFVSDIPLSPATLRISPICVSSLKSFIVLFHTFLCRNFVKVNTT